MSKNNAARVCLKRNIQAARHEIATWPLDKIAWLMYAVGSGQFSIESCYAQAKAVKKGE